MACMSSEVQAYCAHSDRGIAGYTAGTSIVAWISDQTLMIPMKRNRVVIVRVLRYLCCQILLIEVMVRSMQQSSGLNAN